MGRTCGAAGAMGAMGLAGVRGSGDRGVADLTPGLGRQCVSGRGARPDRCLHLHPHLREGVLIYARASCAGRMLTSRAGPSVPRPTDASSARSTSTSASTSTEAVLRKADADLEGWGRQCPVRPARSARSTSSPATPPSPSPSLPIPCPRSTNCLTSRTSSEGSKGLARNASTPTSRPLSTSY